MPLFDLPVSELRRYAPQVDEPGDFDEFWSATLAETRAAAELAPEFVPVDTGLELVEVFDVTFSGFGGQRIRGWFLVPAGRPGPLPCVVQFQGYGGGRGLPHQWLYWANAGYAHLFMDTRGQGSGWSLGDTADPVGSEPAHPGFMTRGVGDPSTYYYRRVFSDAVRAVEAARAHPLVDASRVFVTGGSQGGGITLAVAGLIPDLSGAMPDVPFLCDFRRAVEITPNDPYTEISRYLKVHRDKVACTFRTLSYFDGVSFARRATAPTLFSVALMDQTCPPSTVYAAYNAYAGPDKRIIEYPFNDHEGGGPFHDREQLTWVRTRT
ncbi:acetylxylan esterase [Acrocarpospora catenulata]|uniref:acetylxylan esterase n=1 Tax=Acrocarpospora catenulata TaxID=2836182 RepID=UPI001BDA972E|nr:acetylxylan esterase [Acrocarpospora catenulata]